ncbi:hypothetical protein ACLKA7_001385 [Drosophila subpalustris]
MISPPAAHEPFTPAPRHAGSFADVLALRTPSFNVPFRDKHWLVGSGQNSWNNTYACVRDFRYNLNRIYCEFQDSENFVEAYDLARDPYQLHNIGYDMLPIERALYSILLKNLTKCVAERQRQRPSATFHALATRNAIRLNGALGQHFKRQG